MGKESRKLHFKEKEHQLKALWFEYLRVEEARSRLGWIELDKPYQLGWDRFFVLKPDTYFRKDADVIEKILTVINTTLHSRNKKFTYKDYRSKKTVMARQHTKQLERKDFEKFNEQEKSYFEVSFNFKSKSWGYQFKYENLLTFKIVPHIITHVREIDPLLESRYRELDNMIYGNGSRKFAIKKVFSKTQGKRYDSDESHISVLRNNETFKNMLKE